MPDPISPAFGNLEDRTDQGDQNQTPDRISLRDHIVEIDIGAFQIERGTKQRVSFDVVVEVAPHTNPLNDDVDQILSYEMLVEAIAHELAAERINLLETLADRIADRILLAPQATRVFLRIQKLDLGPGALGVEIVRTGVDDTADNSDLGRQKLPVLVFLSNRSIVSRHLSGWLDQLQESGKPVILCVGHPDITAPKSKVTPAQRRIDLLAIEQNAWVLAGQDDRCLVINTHAEFEWAARKHRLSVWAPSKITLDAVDGPTTVPGNALELTVWFANHMKGERLIVVDADAPITADLPVSSIPLGRDIF